MVIQENGQPTVELAFEPARRTHGVSGGALVGELTLDRKKTQADRPHPPALVVSFGGFHQRVDDLAGTGRKPDEGAVRCDAQQRLSVTKGQRRLGPVVRV